MSSGLIFEALGAQTIHHQTFAELGTVVPQARNDCFHTNSESALLYFWNLQVSQCSPDTKQTWFRQSRTWVTCLAAVWAWTTACSRMSSSLTSRARAVRPAVSLNQLNVGYLFAAVGAFASLEAALLRSALTSLRCCPAEAGTPQLWSFARKTRYFERCAEASWVPVSEAQYFRSWALPGPHIRPESEFC